MADYNVFVFDDKRDSGPSTALVKRKRVRPKSGIPEQRAPFKPAGVARMEELTSSGLGKKHRNKTICLN